MGYVAGVGETGACAGCEVGVSLCSEAVLTLSGAGSAPKLLEQQP